MTISVTFKSNFCYNIMFVDTEIEDFPSLVHEQIVKSPPEPTRVKSPEQVVIRSPEPVNWTVPLDTGKTFTVTQNIREGTF